MCASFSRLYIHTCSLVQFSPNIPRVAHSLTCKKTPLTVECVYLVYVQVFSVSFNVDDDY